MTNAARAERNGEEERYRELLANCGREPIHRPGRVQSHGALLILDPAGQYVRCISDNLPGMLGIDRAGLLDANFSSLPIAAALAPLIHQAANGGTNELRTITGANGERFDVSVIRSEDGHSIIEFERSSSTATDA